jgi:hypothetical protein
MSAMLHNRLFNVFLEVCILHQHTETQNTHTHTRVHACACQLFVVTEDSATLVVQINAMEFVIACVKL